MSGKEGSAKHFSQTISPGLKEKLSLHRLLRQASSSGQDHLRPPEAIAKRLLPLHGLCTYNLMDNLRFGECKSVEWDEENMAVTTDEWFGQLRELTSEWSYRPQNAAKTRCESLAGQGMLSHQWRSMGEELLALDRAARVPNNSLETRNIYDAILSIPEWIVREIQIVNTQTLVEIFPIGSYPNDARVGDIDEFDFLLILDTQENVFNEYARWSDEMRIEIPRIISRKLYPPGEDDLRSVDLNHDQLSLDREPIIASVFSHGPAQCIELMWRCDKGHSHLISVDITLADKNQNQSLLKPELAEMKDMPVLGECYRRIPDNELTVRLLRDRSTSISVVEPRIYQVLHAVSPHVLPAYRIVKVLNHYILPSTVAQEPGATRFATSSIISSHALKQAWYHEVMENPQAEDWTTDKLHLRVAGILDYIQVGDTKSVVYMRSVHDGRTQLQQDLNKTVLFESLSKHLDNLSALIHYIKYALPYKHGNRTQDISSIAEFPKRVNLLLCHKDYVHPCDEHPNKMYMIGDSKGSVLAYKINDSPMLYSSHPLVRWCKSQITNIYNANKGADFSVFTQDEFKWTWALYKAGLASIQQLMDNNTCRQAVGKLKEAFKRFSAFGCRVHVDPVLMKFYIGLDQQIMQESFLKQDPESTSGFASEYWTESISITKVLGKLATRERAFILKWCQLVVERGTDRVFGCDTIRYSHILSSEGLTSIVICLEHLHLIIQRFAEDRTSALYLRAHILIKDVAAYLLTTDLDYFHHVTQDDYDWAQRTISEITATENQLRDESYCSCSNDYQDILSVQLRVAFKQRLWAVVRVARGAAALYRCAAVCGASTVELMAPRSTAGVLLTVIDETNEDFHAREIRVELWALCRRAQKDLLEKPNLYQPYESMDDKLESMMKESIPPGYFEMVLLAYHFQTPLHIYQRAEKNGDYKLNHKIPNTLLSGKPPMNILHYPSDSSSGAHYNLLIHRDQNMADYSWGMPVDLTDESEICMNLLYTAEALKERHKERIELANLIADCSFDYVL